MNLVYPLIKKLRDNCCVSGFEQQCAFPFENCVFDESGNAYVQINGTEKNGKTILFEAHRDVIGFCVQEILDGGFVKLSPCGGIDPDIIPGTVFKIYGKETITAVATSIPPHLSSVDAKNKKNTVEDLFLDTGFSDLKKLKENISQGDPVTFAAECVQVGDDAIVSPFLDNNASVSALLLTIQSLKKNPPKHNCLFLFSSGEETNSRGVRHFCKRFSPDVAVVVDVGFGCESNKTENKMIQMKGGPSVSFTDTFVHTATDWVVSCAKAHDLALQFVAEPRGTGTSGTALQLECGGMPVCLISIPILNMHTPSEILYASDVEKTAELILALAHTEEIPAKEVFFGD